MSTETHISPCDTAEEGRVSQIYDLDETRWLALPDEAKVALAVAEVAVERESFESAGDLTAALTGLTLLDKDGLRKVNTSLLQKGYFDRTGFATNGAVRLELTESGHNFVEESIIRVQ